MRLFYIFLSSLLLFLFTGCTGRNGIAENAENDSSAELAAIAEKEAAAIAAMERAEKERAIRYEASRIASAMNDRQLAAQVIITGIDGKERLSYAMRVLLAEAPAGGIMLFRYNLDTNDDTIRGLLAESANLIMEGAAVDSVMISPFISVDHEGGRVSRFLPGVADLPPASFYREIAENENWETAIAQIKNDSYNMGKIINRLGVTMNLAPVAEHLTPDNDIFLAERSYGPEPDFVVKASGAFIDGMKMAGIICVIKHFPGSVGLDPHYYAGAITGGRAALVELAAPFAALINNNRAQAIMISHSAIPAWDEQNIASLSPAVMNDWLRGELGFKGIIICDDFSMGAVTTANRSRLRPETAAVQSIIAGADMILVWPPDLRRTHRAILAALSDGSLSRERLQDAAERILFEKLQMGLVLASG